jgi:hypothetical protein
MTAMNDVEDPSRNDQELKICCSPVKELGMPYLIRMMTPYLPHKEPDVWQIAVLG